MNKPYSADERSRSDARLAEVRPFVFGYLREHNSTIDILEQDKQSATKYETDLRVSREGVPLFYIEDEVRGDNWSRNRWPTLHVPTRERKLQGDLYIQYGEKSLDVAIFPTKIVKDWPRAQIQAYNNPTPEWVYDGPLSDADWYMMVPNPKRLIPVDAPHGYLESWLDKPR